MSEIATWSMIRSKISSFPAPTSGRGNECLTKSEIISMGGNGVEVSGSYGNQETVVLDNIGAVTWEYVLSVSVSSLSFAGAGGTKSFTVTSTKQKKVNGVNSGSLVNVSYSNSVSGSGFSISGNSVSAGNNASSSFRSGTVTVIQGESGKKVTVSLSQDIGVNEDTPYYIEILNRTDTDCHCISGYSGEIVIEAGCIDNFLHTSISHLTIEFERYTTGDLNFGFMADPPKAEPLFGDCTNFIYSSYPDNTMVIQVTDSRSGKINFLNGYGSTSMDIIDY